MKVAIIEDEERAINFLERMLISSHDQAEAVAKIPSVSEGIVYFSETPDVDLIISDIQLGDGLSFEIFETVKVNCPVIFVTAYDQYAIRAFKSNGIDYILKPVDPDQLKIALDKASKLVAPSNDKMLSAFNQILGETKSYKKRFVAQIGAKIKVVDVADVAVIYSMQKGTYVFTAEGRSYAIDQSLESVHGLLDPEQFFRVNRSAIVSVEADKEIVQWSTSRLKIIIPGLDDIEIIVARERTKEFKMWLDQ